MATRFKTSDNSLDITYGQAFELNGIKYPKNWLKYATPQDLFNIGLTKYTTTPDPTPTPPVPHPRDYPLSKRQFLYALGEVDIYIDEVEGLLITYVNNQGNNRLKNRVKVLWQNATKIEWDDPIISGLLGALARDHPEISAAEFRAAWLAAKDI